MSREYFGPRRERQYNDEFEYSENNYGAPHPRNGISNALSGTVRGRSRSISRSSSRSRSIGAYDRINNRRDNHYERTYPPYRTTYGSYDYPTGPGGFYNNRDMSRTPSPVAHYPGLSHPPNEEARYGRYQLREERDDFVPSHNWETRSNYNHQHYYDDPSPRGRRYSTDSYYRSRSHSRSPYDYFGRDAYIRNRRSPSPLRGAYARASSRSQERHYYDSPLDRSPNYLQRDRVWERNNSFRRERGRAPMRPRFNSPRGGPRRQHDSAMRRNSVNRGQLSEGEVDSKSSRQLSTKSPSPDGSNVASPDRAPGESEQRRDMQPPPPTAPVPAPPPTQVPPPPAGRGSSYYPMAPRFQQGFSQHPPYYVPGRGSTFPPQNTQAHNFPPRAPPQLPRPWVTRDTPRDMGFFQRPDLPRPPFHIPPYGPNQSYNRPPPRYPPSINRPPPRPTSFDRSIGLRPSDPKPFKTNSADLPGIVSNQELVESPSSHNPTFMPPPPPTASAPQSILDSSPLKHGLPRPPPTGYMPSRRSSATFLKTTPKPDFLIQFENGLYPHPWPSKLDDDSNERALELRRLRSSEAEIRASLARSKFDLLLSSLEVERLELSLNTKVSDL
ncbi:hypothetical protein DSO57_1011145 [Entomophthora muscae]|uniref:Uncharacterized protein n=1 Tax=Entomophthora muscae TaxID=34485 RepID=A0ACC2SVZ3_9FUNG|nr:hypothetical protein DSO57_1011145 [Entomophthora muscae]